MRPLIFSLFILFSCSSPETSEQKTVSAREIKCDTTGVQADRTDKDDTDVSETDDCVFDTSTFKFTTEAIHAFNPKIKYQWIKEEAQAIVPLEQGDTLVLDIGGCNHFSYHAIYKTSGNRFNDENYEFEKAEWIAKNFFTNGFDDGFVYYIKNKKYTLETETDEIRAYSITTDSTTSEIDIYDGFNIQKIGNRTIIEIIGYTN